jgi:hypothetical protein
VNSSVHAIGRVWPPRSRSAGRQTAPDGSDRTRR